MRTRARLVGRIDPPGDKSLSHRALILASIAGGRTRFEHLNPGDDVASTAAALRALGVRVGKGPRTRFVESSGAGEFRAPSAPIDCGNSGTTMRLVAGVLAGCPFDSVLIGDPSLSRRPMGRVARPLKRMGARVEGRGIAGHAGEELFAPLRIHGGKLRAIRHCSNVASAQVKSAILLAALVAGVRAEIEEPVRSRDHTERLMRALGSNVRVRGRHVSFSPGGTLARLRGRIPGDPSAAAFFAGAAAALPGSDLRIERVLLNPTRLGFLRLLRRLGARVDITQEEVWWGEPVGSVRVRAGRLRSFRIGAREVPALIDEIPILAVLAAGACRGRSRITGAGELRVKESDRIATLSRGLNALGGQVRELDDGLEIEGGTLHGGWVDSDGDHRLAMAFRVASLLANGRVLVRGSESSRVSHPGFGRELARLRQRGAT